MQWDFANITNWKPLWTPGFPKPKDLYSLQPETFVYDDAPTHLKHELEVLLTNKIILRVMEDRSRYVTRWNIECNRRLYYLLDTMEADMEKPDTGQYHIHEMRDLLQLYNVSEFFLAKNPSRKVEKLFN